jgi:mono/diheme cytochrome c family protein
MMRKGKLAGALALVACACAIYSVSAGAQRPARSGVNAGAVYQQHCARCHGADGDADTDQGRLYDATDFTDANWWSKERPTDSRLRRSIARGRPGGMPAYAKRLSAAEINALVTYVRGFKGR